MADLTDAEAAVYDRQLRIWGVETQKRLNSGRVLIVNCTGLAAEVAKNIVLAGVGSVTLLDETPCARRDPTNFLIPADGPADTSAASAAAAALQEINPLVRVAALRGSLADLLSPPETGANALDDADVVVLTNASLADAAALDAACVRGGRRVALFAAESRGPVSYFFANLGEAHAFTSTEPRHLQSDSKGLGTARFVPLATALATPWKGSNPRKTHKLRYLLSVLYDFEREAGQRATPADAPALLEAAEVAASAAGLDASKVTSRELLDQYIGSEYELPPVNAVTGGILANEVVKALGGRGEPHNNFFFFCLSDGKGMVEQMHGPQ